MNHKKTSFVRDQEAETLEERLDLSSPFQSPVDPTTPPTSGHLVVHEKAR